ncbi:MAG: T9SS type A sorting domain-containing protein [Ferruginibacter sp.]
MKKIFTFFVVLFISLKGMTQNTYYWVGGAGPASFTANASWNTTLDGSGDSRSVAGSQDTDVLIFDGDNIGGSNPATGNIIVNASNDTIGRMIFRNNVHVKFSRSSAGSSAISIMGEGTNLDDLQIGSGSVITLGDEIYNYNVRIILGLATVPTTATGLVSGTLYIGPLSQTIHPASYVTSLATNGLVFAAGGECHATDSTTASPFNGSANNSVLFQTGSSLHYYSGRSPFGNSSAVQFANFEPGSSFYAKGSNVSYLDGTAYASSSWSNLKSFADFYVQNGATFRCDGPVYRIDDLNIAAGSSFITHSSGYTPVLGDLTVNGVFNFPSGSNSLVMGGEALQTIAGSGTIDVPIFIVADNSNVLLNKTITVTTTANIIGDLDFGAGGRITGAAAFTSRVASTLPSGIGSTVAGSYQLTYTSPSSFTGYSISGPGIAPNTNIVGFGSSANSVYLSKPALSTQSNVTFDFTTDTALLKTANPNGFNESTGSVTVSGTRTFQSGTHYTINAATAYPFGISSSASGSISLGNVTLNAPVTTNYNYRIAGTLALNSGNLTISAGDTVRILSGNAIAGAPFSSSKYIVSQASTTETGVLRIDNISSATQFPVGNAAYYLPVTLTPSAAADFAVSVFQGATEDGSITGTATATAQKAEMVDAVWTIDRINGSGDCQVALQWASPLEGAAFAGFTNEEVGVSRYDGTQWTASTGNGDNVANTVTESFSSFSPFIVTKKAGVLPMQLKNIYATAKTVGTEIGWELASNQDEDVLRYEVEKSTDRVSFTTVATVNAARQLRYSALDITAPAPLQYYRLKIIYHNGNTRYSNTLLVKTAERSDVSIYPNPVKDRINISGLKNTSTIRIVNSTGNVILQQKTTATTLSMDAAGLKPGLYLLEAFTENGTRHTQTFIKQ